MLYDTILTYLRKNFDALTLYQIELEKKRLRLTYYIPWNNIQSPIIQTEYYTMERKYESLWKLKYIESCMGVGVFVFEVFPTRILLYLMSSNSKFWLNTLLHGQKKTFPGSIYKLPLPYFFFFFFFSCFKFICEKTFVTFLFILFIYFCFSSTHYYYFSRTYLTRSSEWAVRKYRVVK